ncbi:hypothetical protein GN956_G6829 [Arapaima gigas]
MISTEHLTSSVKPTLPEGTTCLNSPPIASTALSPAITKHAITSLEFSTTITEHTPALPVLSTTTVEHTTSTELSISTEHIKASTELSTNNAELSTFSTKHATASTQHITASTEHILTSTHHTTASAQHVTASTEHSTAFTEHTKTSAEHIPSSTNHTPTSTEHIVAATEHTAAPTEHTTASAAHAIASTEHANAPYKLSTTTTDPPGLYSTTTEHTTAFTVLSTTSEHTSSELTPATEHVRVPAGLPTGIFAKLNPPTDYTTASTGLFTTTDIEQSATTAEHLTQSLGVNKLPPSSTKLLHNITNQFSATKVPVSTTKLPITSTQPPPTAITPSPTTTQLESTTTYKESLTLPSMDPSRHAPSLVQCSNGGELVEKACICPDDYTGLSCDTENFCNETIKNGFTFNKTAVGWFSYSMELCNSTGGKGWPKATVRCTRTSGLAQFQEPRTVICDTTLAHLRGKASSTSLQSIATTAQILTSRAKDLTAKNITVAAQIAMELLLSSTSEEDVLATVATISQLLNASSSEVSSLNTSTTKSLTLALEKFSLNQNVSVNGSAIIQPNLAVQSVNLLGGFTRGIQFSVVASKSQSYMFDQIYLNTNATQLTVNALVPVSMSIFIKFPPGGPRKAANVGFVLYQNDKFFRSTIFTTPLGTSRSVISAAVSSRRRGNRKLIPEFVELLYRPLSIPGAILEDFACVFWDYNLADWSTRGCAKSTRSNESSLNGSFVSCICNHTSSFTVLMSFRKNVSYSEALDWTTFIGCFVLIVVLCVTILLELIFSNCWMSSSTVMLVSTYLSLLLFNLLFVVGATNRPPPRAGGEIDGIQNRILPSDRHMESDVGSCTAVAALLHFFLLASFTWNAIFTTETLLVRLKKGPSQLARLLPSHINLVSSAVGWGFPLLLVSVTLALWYHVDDPLQYRQEEFCWLAALDEEWRFDVSKPMLWSFLSPVALVLLLNITEVVYFMATTSERALRHNKRKADNDWNVVKEFVSSLSLAVLLVLCSLLGYLMLLNRDPDVHGVLSIIFCIFNIIQALQIFLLIPDWGQVFSVLPSLPSPAVSLGLHSKKYHIRPQQGDEAQEVYRKMETGFTASFQPLSPSLKTPLEAEEKEP